MISKRIKIKGDINFLIIPSYFVSVTKTQNCHKNKNITKQFLVEDQSQTPPSQIWTDSLKPKNKIKKIDRNIEQKIKI